MQAIETKHGTLILDDDRWVGPDGEWCELPTQCRTWFNSKSAAEAQIARLQAEIEKVASDTETGTATGAKKAKRFRGLADSGKAASGELDYTPAA